MTSLSVSAQGERHDGILRGQLVQAAGGREPVGKGCVELFIGRREQGKPGKFDHLTEAELKRRFRDEPTRQEARCGQGPRRLRRLPIRKRRLPRPGSPQRNGDLVGRFATSRITVRICWKCTSPHAVRRSERAIARRIAAAKERWSMTEGRRRSGAFFPDRFRQSQRLSGASGDPADRTTHRREIRLCAGIAWRRVQADQQPLAGREPRRHQCSRPTISSSGTSRPSCCPTRRKPGSFSLPMARCAGGCSVAG